MTGRSANSGFCSHSCRWDYKLLEEKERPGEYFPVYEGDDFTAILSSKDICMIDHLDDMKKAGVDSLKIEGRMKSLYYAALVTRSYRKAVDALEGKIASEEAAPYIDELYKTNHREFATGFFYSQADANKTTRGETKSDWELVGTIGKALSEEESEALFTKAEQESMALQNELDAMHPEAKKARLKDLEMHPEKRYRPLEKKEGFRLYTFTALNKLTESVIIEYIGPDIISISDTSFSFVAPEDASLLAWVTFNNECLIYTDKAVDEGFIVRSKTQNQGRDGSR
jgi:putative protease